MRLRTFFESILQGDIDRKWLQAHLISKYPGLDLFLGGRDEYIRISTIIIPEDSRGEGIGTKVMKDLTEYADDNYAILVLTPSTDYGATSVSRLKSFYKKFGFVDNKGKNKDWAVQETMIRHPK